MTAILLANVASTLFMAGLIWVVQLVLYPVMGEVGDEHFETVHALESRRITWLVLPAMSVELISSAALALAPPDGVSGALAWTGAALAAATWVSTGLIQVPAHNRLTAASVPSLVAGNRLRTALWSAHAGIVVAILASSLA